MELARLGIGFRSEGPMGFTEDPSLAQAPDARKKIALGGKKCCPRSSSRSAKKSTQYNRALYLMFFQFKRDAMVKNPSWPNKFCLSPRVYEPSIRDSCSLREPVKAPCFDSRERTINFEKFLWAMATTFGRPHNGFHFFGTVKRWQFWKLSSLKKVHSFRTILLFKEGKFFFVYFK